MTRISKAKQAEYDVLKEESEIAIAAAKKEKKENPCAETRAAYSQIWNSYNDRLCKICPPKGSGYASRAGQRQYQERISHKYR